MLTFARNYRTPRGFRSQRTASLPHCFPLRSKEIIIDYHLTLKPAICFIDRAELEFAMLNITTNAGHAMPKGGCLEIDTSLVLVAANAKLDLTSFPANI
jgi:hypothetical protein